MLTTYIKSLQEALLPMYAMLSWHRSRWHVKYAVPVWQSIPDYLSAKIESIQKRALKIIFPFADSYSDALKGIRSLRSMTTSFQTTSFQRIVTSFQV